jgi:hypothetical protein
MKTWLAFVINLIIAATCITGVARADETAKIQARQHFKQGVELFDQRRFGDALAEFERSYALFPVYSTLYNVGQVQVALGHPVQAVDAFEKYLVQGGASVSPEQRSRVEAELKIQRERVGELKLVATPEGAEIRVDGEPIGKAPVKNAVRVAAGHHRVEAMLDGYRTEQSEIDVSGQGHVELMFKLQSLLPMTAPAATAEPLAPKAQPAPANLNIAVTTPVQKSDSPNSGTFTSPPLKANTSESASTGGVQRALGYTIAGLGLIGAGVGIAYAVDGQSKHDDALTEDAQGQKALAQQTESDSSKEKTKGYLTIGAGGAVMLTGAILLVAAPSGHSESARVNWSPWVGTSGLGASVGGTW